MVVVTLLSSCMKLVVACAQYVCVELIVMLTGSIVAVAMVDVCEAVVPWLVLDAPDTLFVVPLTVLPIVVPPRRYALCSVRLQFSWRMVLLLT